MLNKRKKWIDVKDRHFEGGALILPILIISVNHFLNNGKNIAA
jgi:hypothetical protein